MVVFIYSSKYGFTHRIMQQIARDVSGSVRLINVLDHNEANIRKAILKAHLVVLGGPIYGGQLEHELEKTIAVHYEQLVTKRLILFISGLQNDEFIQQEIEENFPATLLNSALGSFWIGGAIDALHLSRMDRLLLSKSLRHQDSQYMVNHPQIETMCHLINESTNRS